MVGFLVRRVAAAAGVLAVVGVLTFALTFIAPADPVRAIVGPQASAESVEQVREALGLDRPFLTQLGRYFERLVHGDLGHSYKRNAPVLDLILERFPATAQLAVAGLGVSILIGVPLGVVAAQRRGRWVDGVARVLASVLLAAPLFWIGYVLLFVLAFLPAIHVSIEIFPIARYRPFDIRYLALPALTLGLAGAGYYARLVRVATLEELQRDYIRTARAKGVTEGTVARRHAFRNAAPVVLTQVGLDLGAFMGGVVVVEQVFGWPGLGWLALDAIRSEDLPLLMGTVLFGTLCVVVASLVVDLAQAALDPRLGPLDER